MILNKKMLALLFCLVCMRMPACVCVCVTRKTAQISTTCEVQEGRGRGGGGEPVEMVDGSICTERTRTARYLYGKFTQNRLSFFPSQNGH